MYPWRCGSSRCEVRFLNWVVSMVQVHMSD
nr:MAG TPA: DNA polymerase family B [Bacteriophage sp.]DAM84124.1 MAG TPA: DNA polymerase family B [Bacteriophage sp.]DAO69548.1 MAG TPA: DNA polymerase family B [Bacteriophage sp.]DAV33605.1 MAG TPA: DNA polymerase family B [Bacteriophage sp.]DAV77950.1 MAG TPA: DNA polymerase family B [Bacteriophage sp.]